MRMRKICLLLLLASSASGLLTSCTTEEPWPPFSDRVTSAFHDDRADFVELENRLLESKYFEVRLLGTTGAYGTYVDAGAINEEAIVPDGHVWADLFITTKMMGVARIDTGTTFDTGINPFVSVDDRELTTVGRLLVVHSEYVFREADHCDDSYRLLPDGECYLPLSDNWGALYSWTKT